MNRLWRSFIALPGILSRTFGYVLLFVQFVDFFYNSDLGAQQRSLLNRNANKIPVAPHKRLRETSVMLLETDKCPICLRHRHNDTVLNVSGYVFCYECISDFVRRERKCPVTSLPATMNNLIQIFYDLPK
ncbi:Putative peroxisome assembly protein 12 [Toxocara canis]|uniref:Peroxisome assembly protein 12 n=1 Tax=Toxocara canis TaxID=6265 RepID=A0A0B2UPL4_TOXCA|nr:Putative peroxisome assembly protein 12 [Toxocara canis]